MLMLRQWTIWASLGLILCCSSSYTKNHTNKTKSTQLNEKDVPDSKFRKEEGVHTPQRPISSIDIVNVSENALSPSNTASSRSSNILENDVPGILDMTEWAFGRRDVLAFATTAEYDHIMRRTAFGGMVEDQSGVTVCIAFSKSKKKAIVQKDTTQSNNAPRCVRIENVRIARGVSAFGERKKQTFRFHAPLLFSDSVQVLVIDERQILQSYAIPNAPPAPSQKIFQEGIWPSSVAADNAQRKFAGRAAIARKSPKDRLPFQVQEVNRTEWVKNLLASEDMFTRVLHSEDSQSLMELVETTYPVRTTLIVRDDTHWLRSEPVEEEEHLFGARLSAFDEKWIVLTRTTQEGSALEMEYGDRAYLKVMEPIDDSLREVARIHLGEIGFVQVNPTQSHTWRIFFSVSFIGENCIQLSLHHAFSAPFNRRNGQFGAQKKIVLQPDADEDSVESRYANHAGTYLLSEDTFVKQACP